ncbi:hypothetical protein GUJ93_ZPchr0015g6628 [Zizania palustris]|uniref:Uncharacterized protein n=1 Tax=Zizania palustris TaxID=103762 RepID=A0A8J5VSW6_ZIZPA|nr:hypothetical protein GUJ93_ZPchr0015g6628 [Zizania palustris]
MKTRFPPTMGILTHLLAKCFLGSRPGSRNGRINKTATDTNYTSQMLILDWLLELILLIYGYKEAIGGITKRMGAGMENFICKESIWLIHAV